MKWKRPRLWVRRCAEGGKAKKNFEWPYAGGKPARRAPKGGRGNPFLEKLKMCARGGQSVVARHRKTRRPKQKGEKGDPVRW